MALMNVWLAVRSDTFPDLDAETADGDETPRRRNRVWQDMADQSVVHIYRGRTQGPFSWRLHNIYLHCEGRRQLREAINEYRALVGPGKMIVLGAWYVTSGEQVRGDEADDDNPGTPNEGPPVINLHAWCMDFMPDIVVYDDDGNEVSRDRPAGLSDVNLLAGQAPRDFT